MVRTNRQKWPGLFKQLQMWSSAVDYQRVPDRDLQATQALIESIEHAALRLDALEHARRHSAGALAESQRQSLQRLHDACAESFQMIANSIGDQNPVQALPAIGSLVDDLETKAEDVRLMNMTAHLDSLLDAIADCRDKANAFDWKAWNRNYF
jgi:DNA repair ATPase RecN